MRKINYQKSFELYLAFIAFVICVFPKLITVAIIGLACFTIVGFARKKIALSITKPVLFLALLYLVYLAGTIFTENQYLARTYIENKLTFLIFPILLSFRFKNEMDFRLPVAGIAIGVTVTAVLGILNAADCNESLIQSGNFSCYTSSNLSHIHHPTYFSVYILTALVSVWTGYIQRWKFFRLIWIIPFSVFALTIYGLCLSLAGYLFFFLLMFILFVVLIYKKFGWIMLLCSLVLTPALAILLFTSIPQIKSQFIDSEKVLIEYTSNPEKFIRSKTGYKQGDDIRVIMWTVSAHEFEKHLFGVGTGNVDLHLSWRLHTYQQHKLAKMDQNKTILYNPHNQFLQTGLEIGVEGLAVLLLVIITAIFFSFKYKNWILLILTGSLVFNSLFESMLQRQSGIVFYSFWLCILVIYSNSKSKTAYTKTSASQ